MVGGEAGCSEWDVLVRPPFDCDSDQLADSWGLHTGVCSKITGDTLKCRILGRTLQRCQILQGQVGARCLPFRKHLWVYALGEMLMESTQHWLLYCPDSTQLNPLSWLWKDVCGSPDPTNPTRPKEQGLSLV